MAQPVELGPQSSATMTLDYIHAPVVASVFLCAYIVAVCVLQKQIPLPLQRRRIAKALVLTMLTGYVAELLYYLVRNISEADFEPPQHAAFHCLGSILVWIPLSLSIVASSPLKWRPYFCAFVAQFCFEVTICVLKGVYMPKEDVYSSVPLAFSSLRAVASLGLLINAFFILISKEAEKGTDEESQSLLGKPANVTAAQPGDAGYGAIESSSSSTTVVEERDRNQEIKDKQAKRLEEEGGWLGYLKGFLVFLPYLWPKNDWRIMGCLALRFVDLFLGRFLNLLVPRQLGIITDKLANGATRMPWADIALWGLYQWLNSYSGFAWIDSFASTYIQKSAFRRITILAYEHLMNLSMDFHSSKDSGEVLKAVEQAAALNSLVELVLFEIGPIVIDIFVAMWYVTHLFNGYLAFIILFMGLLYIYIGINVTNWAQAKRRTYVANQRLMSTTVNETIHNWTTTAYFNRSSYEVERYGSNIRTTIKSYFTYYWRSMTGHMLQSALTNVGFLVCSIFAIKQIIYDGKPIGNLVAFIMFWTVIVHPLYLASYSFKHVSSVLIDAERLLQLLNTKSTVTDIPGAPDLQITAGRVELKNVDFHYDPRKQIIHDANLVAEGGQTIAFVGETGGGKSTMLKLLFRFYDVTKGSITIDGQDIRQVGLSSLREALGVVPQDSTLFNQTIRQNVRYSRLDATDEEIEDACRAAAIHDDIMSFPDGYNSKIGERGVKISGGQLQRVAIARVLLKNPKIVLLDEATSAIDSGIEGKIQEAFRKLSKGRTTFVIAHRLSTIVDADQILVVDKGAIIERGTHSELLELGGKYTELWVKQTAGHVSAPSSVTASKANSTHGDGKGEEILIDLTPDNEGGGNSK
ncbi:ATP-binding cassette-type vacuolar membrane transporter-like protein Hmt1 [Pleomassaria siparia CBS 279.74]|uniref:ATP-binding cassette-type vacuolar membrane transporter-like protein Hmt1 n=1 Tax=Pleomassaria siparia CBS 279.74 TaxID=1314801 RepID=A0A6G1KKW6_9PLEO|nr:ATP-binding cassette-type vacuolar membrane transporter-like protein Hmt1 [Pleomassaria siparia CBS 279.74]